MNASAIRFQMAEEDAYTQNWRRLARQARQVFDEDYAKLCDVMANEAEARVWELKKQLDVYEAKAIDAHIETQGGVGTG